jgi:site-specific recombinase XerD
MKRKRKTKNLPQLIREYLSFKMVTKSRNTIDCLEMTLLRFAEFCLDRSLHPLKSETTYKWVAHLRSGKKIKGGTINNYVSRLRSFFSYLVDSGYIDKNPAKLVDALPPEHKEIVGFNHNEAKVLLESAGKHRHSNYWVPMILFGWHYGMRISDCSHVTHEEIDMNRKQIVFMPKKQRRRYIRLPLHTDIYDALTRAELGDGDYLFPLAVRKYEVRTLSAEFKSIIKSGGLPESYTFHCLRHGAATNMLKMGIRMTTITEIIGWSTPAMLYKYMDADQEEMDKVLDGESIAV